MKYIDLLRQTEKELETAEIEVKVESARLELQRQMLDIKQSLITTQNRVKKAMREELNFATLISLQDDIALLERRTEQLKKLNEELF